ncbi:hypothetical protein B0T22DRAFT_486772 [Podospora appendiculata]|uniref:Uncharacterized protein n=1 Tax=Podospora appendiculata TaxID=314037 RepID=A0AAE0XGD5_9PEZI|nr:hypothetical protein B0T22DRAFT_486772 [Podospora appendiculata]
MNSTRQLLPFPLLLYLLLLLIATVSVSATPAPTITSMTYSGNGCPQGSVTARVVLDTDASDNNKFKLVAFFADNKLQPILGPDIPISGNKRRQCQVHYRVVLDPAFRLHINARGIDLVGYVPLVAGLKFQLAATMWLNSMDMMTTSANLTVIGDGFSIGPDLVQHGSSADAGISNYAGGDSIYVSINSLLDDKLSPGAVVEAPAEEKLWSVAVSLDVFPKGRV